MTNLVGAKVTRANDTQSKEKVEEDEVGDLYPVTFQDRPRHLVNPSLGVQATGTSGLIG